MPANSHSLGMSLLHVHLKVENFDLTSIRAYCPISHAWLKIWAITVVADTFLKNMVTWTN